LHPLWEKTNADLENTASPNPYILWGLSPGGSGGSAGPCRNLRCALLKLHAIPMQLPSYGSGYRCKWTSMHLVKMAPHSEQDQHCPVQAKRASADDWIEGRCVQDVTAGCMQHT